MRRTVRHIVLATLVASSYMFVAAAVTTGAEPRYSYVAVDYPSAVATSLSGINARGDIVGNYVDSNGMFHGFVLRDGAFATIDVPGASSADTGCPASRQSTSMGICFAATARSNTSIIPGRPIPSRRGSCRMAQSSAVITAAT